MSKCPYNASVRRPEEPATKVCTQCKKELPITEFGYITKELISKTRWYRRSQCYKCMYIKDKQRKIRKLKLESQEKRQPLDAPRTCKRDCKLYPCFAGIDTLRTNLSLTCKHYEPTEHQESAD